MAAKIIIALFAAGLLSSSSALPAPSPEAPADLVVPANMTLPLSNPGYTHVEYFEGSYVKGRKPASLTDYNLTKVDSFAPSSSITARQASDINCPVRVTRKYTVTGHGTWYTPWCHQPGANTLYPGAAAGRVQTKSTSVTFSAEASLAGALSEAIDASIGLKVEISKSSGVYQGCTNLHNYPTTIWWQEKMGWSQTTVETEIQDCDGGASTTESVHADYPDPDNTGFRELVPGCGSKPSNDGPYCDFNADHL